MRKSTSGFTIVELLIVIVVIAIIAAITLVAFSSVQTRTENTKTTHGVSEYVKALHSYSALNGTYPVEANYPCLGPMGTICARISGAAVCAGSGGDGGAATQATFDTKMKDIFSGDMPNVSSQRMNCNGNVYGGAYYRPSTGNTAVIVYYLKGDQACAGVGGVSSYSKLQQEELTRCIATLQTIP